MINTFIKQTIELLKQSDLSIRLTEIRPVEFSFDQDDTHTVYLYARDNFSTVSLQDNFILQVMIMFSVLDALIDSKYPNLEGQSFYFKYKNLPDNTEEEIMNKEVYRIFKLLRNASIHSMSSVQFSKTNTVHISYNFKSTNYLFEINKQGIELLYTFVFENLRPLNEVTVNHRIGIKRKLYDELLLHITNIQDEFGNMIMPISNNTLRIKRVVRYLVKNPKFILSGNDILKIQSEYRLNTLVEPYYGVDYLVNLNGKTYLIPQEVMTNNQLHLSNLNDWTKD